MYVLTIYPRPIFSPPLLFPTLPPNVGYNSKCCSLLNIPAALVPDNAAIYAYYNFLRFDYHRLTISPNFPPPLSDVERYFFREFRVESKQSPWGN